MELDPELLKKVQHWQAEGLTEEHMMTRLSDRNIPLDKIKLYIPKTKQKQFDKRSFHAFIYMGIGAFLGFISCVMSMVLENHFYNALFLYGGTSLAIILVLYGSYLLFEE